MKKISVIIIILSAVLFGGCSVQTEMNPVIFIERLSEKIGGNIFENNEIVYEDNKCICFINDEFNTEYVLEFILDESDNIKKISLACNETDKAGNFINYIKDIIGVYSPDENIEEIIGNLTENGKMKPSFSYYETQWYSWSSYSDENGLYFSVSNKKLSEPITAQYSLKPNDKSGY